MTLGQGFRSYILTHLREIAQLATPQYKMDPLGFVNLLQTQSKPKVLQLSNEAGHKNSVQVKYKQRWTKDFVQTGINCDIASQSGYKETAVALSSTVAFNIYIPDSLIENYEDDASKTVMIGKPSTPIMAEFMEEIYNVANALLSQMNEDLLTVLSANIGFNRRSGNNAAQTLNLNKNATVNDLATGLTLLKSDASLNRFTNANDLQVIGAGLFNNFMLEQPAKSASQIGLNTALQAAGVNWFYDLDVATVFGANNIIAIDKNAVQIVEFLRYKGFKSGLRGTSYFGVLPLPMMIGQEVALVEFDFQLKFNDCAKEITEQYYGTTVTLQPGWNLILSKESGLFTIPSDAYRAGDPLVSNRGTLLYDVTNTCTDCT